MFADADVSKTPSPGHLRRQVHADAPVEIKQKVVNGQIRQRSVGNFEFGVGNPFREQRSEFPVAQDAEGSFDVAGGRMRRASRSRIQASSTDSPSIAMELATRRGIASRCRQRRSSSGRLRQNSIAPIQRVSDIAVLPFLQQWIRHLFIRCALVGGAQQGFQPSRRKRTEAFYQIQCAFVQLMPVQLEPASAGKRSSKMAGDWRRSPSAPAMSTGGSTSPSRTPRDRRPFASWSAGLARQAILALP